MRKTKWVPRWRQFFLSLFVFFALDLLWVPMGHCADVTLAWDPNREADLEGYGVYFNQGSPGPPYLLAGYVTLEELDRPYAPSFTVDGLQEGGRYYFAATAFNTSGKESAYSLPVCAEIAAGGAVSACASSDGGSSSGGSSGGGGSECFIACAAAGPAGAGGAWIRLLALSVVAAGLLSPPVRRLLKNNRAGG